MSNAGMLPASMRESSKAIRERMDGIFGDATLQSSIRAALPRCRLDVTRFIRSVYLAAFRQPRIAQCTGASIAAATLQAASLGLPLSGVLGDAYLIPRNRKFKDGSGTWHEMLEANFQLGYRGMLELARRSGDIEDLDAKAVYANEKCVIRYGANATVEHEPVMTGERGELLGAYFWFQLKGARRVQVRYLNVAEIESRRQLSPDSPTHSRSPASTRPSRSRSRRHRLPWRSARGGGGARRRRRWSRVSPPPRCPMSRRLAPKRRNRPRRAPPTRRCRSCRWSRRTSSA